LFWDEDSCGLSWLFKIPILEESPKKFVLEPDLDFSFVPKTDQGETTAHNMGSFLDKNVWLTQYSKVYWHVSWTSKGLAPSKPAVHLSQALVLPAGRAILLSTETM